MHEHHQDDPETLSQIEQLGYDPRDVDPRRAKLPTQAIVMFVSVALVAVFAWFFIGWFGGSNQKPAAVDRSVLPQPPYPLLQGDVTAKKDIQDLRHEERVKSDTAGWVDKEKGVAHIPVDAAIELILREGMPKTPPLESGSSPTPAATIDDAVSLQDGAGTAPETAGTGQ